MSAIDRLAEIEARANAATEGPWVHNGINGVHTEVGSCVTLSYRHDEENRSNDAEFIAHARTDIPALVAALRAVLDSHVAVPVHVGDILRDECLHCFDGPWPCSTVSTITSALDGAS